MLKIPKPRLKIYFFKIIHTRLHELRKASGARIHRLRWLRHSLSNRLNIVILIPWIKGRESLTNRLWLRRRLRRFLRTYVFNLRRALKPIILKIVDFNVNGITIKILGIFRNRQIRKLVIVSNQVSGLRRWERQCFLNPIYTWVRGTQKRHSKNWRTTRVKNGKVLHTRFVTKFYVQTDKFACTS